MNHEIIPSERLIQLITAILRGDEDGLPVFRYLYLTLTLEFCRCRGKG